MTCVCFPLRCFYIVVVPVTTSTLRRWENPEDMDLDEVSVCLWWSHTNNINIIYLTICYLIHVTSHTWGLWYMFIFFYVPQYVSICCSTCYFSPLFTFSVFLHLCCSCWDTQALRWLLKSFSWHFCFFVITTEHSSSDTVLLSHAFACSQ